MKICYLGWGAHVHVERWAAYFAESGHEVSVISVTGRGTYPDGVRQRCLEDVPLSHRLRRLYLGWLLRRIRPDIVHVHWAHFTKMLDGLWNGPLVVTAWGSDIYRLDELGQGVRDDLVRALHRAQLITCDSADLGRTIETTAGLARGAVQVVQWGVDTGRFDARAGDSALARELGIGDRPVILSPRNFTPLYNLDVVVTAFREVLDAFPDAVLVMKYFNADDDYMARIRELISNFALDDSVRILGRIEYDRMPDYYRTGRILVTVASSDATSMSLLEGMACGCAPVVSDLPSAREWITDGWNGRVIPIEPRELTTALVQLLGRPEEIETFARRNQKLILERGSQRSNMGRMESLYRSLVEGLE